MNDHVTRYSNEKIAPKMEILKDMEAITRAGFREKTKVACCLVAGMLTKLFLNIRRCEVGPIECFGVHFPLKSDGTSEIDLDLDGFPKKLKIVLPKQKGMTNPCWIVLWKNNGIGAKQKIMHSSIFFRSRQAARSCTMGHTLFNVLGTNCETFISSFQIRRTNANRFSYSTAGITTV
jgi:hypothetical protein